MLMINLGLLHFLFILLKNQPTWQAKLNRSRFFVKVINYVMCFSSVSYHLSRYVEGRGYGPVMIENLNCQGNEWSIAQCSSKPWMSQTCSHDNDIGVDCGGTDAFCCLYVCFCNFITCTCLLSFYMFVEIKAHIKHCNCLFSNEKKSCTYNFFC